MDTDDEMSPADESKVGKKLSELTTRRVIILVLSMMFSVPFLTLTTYKDENNSFKFGLELINIYPENSAPMARAMASYVSEHKGIRTPLVSLSVYNDSWLKEG